MNERERKAAERSVRGMRARQVGWHFEMLIDEACKHYASTGIADIEKTPEPMKPIKSIGAGRFIAVYTGEAQADYKGYMAGGRAVYFEAKATAGERITQERVTANQDERLNKAWSMGAKVFVLCCVKNRFFKIPWKIWIDMKNIFGHKYFTADEAAEHGLEIGFRAPGVLAFLDETK